MIFIWKNIVPLNLLLGKLVLKSLLSKYDEAFSRSSPFILSFILFKSMCSLLLLFLAMVTKFFLALNCCMEIIVSKTKKGNKSLEQDIQYHVASSSFRF